MKTKSIFRLLYVICAFGFLLSYAQADCVRGSGGGGGGTDYTADANCAGAWFMNNNGGTETDQSGNSESLAVDSGGTVAREATYPSGYSGYSRDSAGGTDDFLYHSDGGSTDIYGADQALSIVAWINGDSFSSDSTIVTKGNIGYNVGYVTWVESDNSHIQFAAVQYGGGVGDSWDVTAVGGTTLSTGTWYHVAVVYNDTDVRIYVNGSLDSNGSNNPKSYSSGIRNSSQLFKVFAGTQSGGDSFDGNLDEVAVFDRALSAAEVLEIYTYGLDGSNGGND